MQTDDVLNWVCQYCGEENQIWVDLTIMDDQDLIEDCEICCRPILFQTEIDSDGNLLGVTTHREDD